MTPNFVNDMNITLEEVNTFNRELSISLEWSEIEKDFDKSAARFSKKKCQDDLKNPQKSFI